MELKEKFKVVYLTEADTFLDNIPAKAKMKILYNIRKSKFVLDKELFKKLDGKDIWEFRTLYNGISYRMLAFWDKEADTLVIACNGFVKKTQKTPSKEIEKAEAIRKEYFKLKH